MEKEKLSLEISRLVNYGLQRGLIAPEDEAYAANRMLALLGLREYEPQSVEEQLRFPAEPLEALCDYAAEQGLIDPDTRDARDQFDTELMNCLMPRPSEVVSEIQGTLPAGQAGRHGVLLRFEPGVQLYPCGPCGEGQAGPPPRNMGTW